MNPKLASLSLPLLLTGCASTSSLPEQRQAHYGPPVAHTAELLRHDPSVIVVGTDNGLKVFVRGSRVEPLVILDGMALPPDPRGVLASINPLDVADIKVLTDPADLTFYGVRGASGVIVIKTKRH
jgi:TonB-dependent SusC/RagA subfamily outer membrane receptor